MQAGKGKAVDTLQFLAIDFHLSKVFASMKSQHIIIKDDRPISGDYGLCAQKKRTYIYGGVI